MISGTIQTGVQSYGKICEFGYLQSNQNVPYSQLYIESGCLLSSLEIFEQYLIYSLTNTQDYLF